MTGLIRAAPRLVCGVSIGVFIVAGCDDGGAVDATEPRAWASLVDAEVAFAEAASADGVGPAFLDVLADDGVVFMPDVVNAVEWYRTTQLPPGAVLEWRPRKAAVSRDGGLGFTTGPWTTRASADSPATGTGHYLSIWRRNAQDWRLVVDIGVSHPPGADHESRTRTEPFMVAAVADTIQFEGPADDGPTAAESMLQSRLAAGAPASEQLASGILVYRDQTPPDTGALAFDLLPRPAPLLRWTLLGDGVANSSDLGYTYGRFDAEAGEASDAISGNFVRLWRRRTSGEWVVVVDLLTLHPRDSVIADGF